jgi:hypothetical protein
VKTGSLPRRLAGLARRFLRHERGSISPVFVLMLIPMCGLMAMAVELGQGTLLQRGQQHAADSAALTAATGNNLNCYDAGGAKVGTVSGGTCTNGTAGFVLEAKSVSSQYPIGNATVSTIQTNCPGSASGATDCYSVTIQRTVPFYLGQVVGIRNMTPKAVAYARTTATVDLCFATLSDFTTDGQSTGFNTCYVESFGGTIKCTSVDYAGLFVADPSKNTQACGGTPTATASATPSCAMPLTGVTPCLAGSIPDTTAVPCDANPTDPTKWSWKTVTTGTPSTTTNYVRLCGTSANSFKITLAGNMSLSANTNNQAVILDNASIDGNGGNYSVSALNTTFISTCSSACNGGTLPAPFQNMLSGNGTTGVTISGPKQNTGTFANFALYDDENKSPAAGLTYSFNDNITGEIYEPNRDIVMSGSQSSSIGGVTCVTMISKSFKSNGGKLVNNPIADCAGNYQVAQQTIANVALVQ